MSILPLRYYGDPVLKEKSTSLEKIENHIKKLAQNMAETMYDAAGIGLAAPQIGTLKKLIVIDMGDNDFVAYINPEIIYYAGKKVVEEEGCLCLPDIVVPVKRASKVGFKAIDIQGRPVEIETDDFLARVFQHEVDHLEGFTILERTNPDERQKAVRKVMEMWDNK